MGLLVHVADRYNPTEWRGMWHVPHGHLALRTRAWVCTVPLALRGGTRRAPAHASTHFIGPVMNHNALAALGCRRHQRSNHTMSTRHAVVQLHRSERCPHHALHWRPLDAQHTGSCGL